MKTDKEQIRENLQMIRKGVTNQNWHEAESYIAKDWVSYQSGAKVSWEEQKHMFNQNVSNHESTFNVQNIVLSEDNTLAVCLASEETDYVFKDEEVHENALFTTCWRKEDGRWKLFHLNRSVNPAQIPESMKEMMA